MKTEKFEELQRRRDTARNGNLKASFPLAEILPLRRGCAAYGAFVTMLFGGLFIIQGKNDGRRPRPQLFADVLGPIQTDARAGHLPERFSAVPHSAAKVI